MRGSPLHVRGDALEDAVAVNVDFQASGSRLFPRIVAAPRVIRAMQS
jgi:hypothetical protein